MCTLSWWIDETERGIVFNRDELRTRSRGAPPRLIEDPEQQTILIPQDPDAGGTWMGVNASGLTVALLNNYPFQSPGRPGQRSRGQLVVNLLKRARSADHGIQLLEQMDLSIYQGFLLFLLGRDDGPYAREWSEAELSDLPLDGSGGLHVLTSSSFRKEECEVFRLELFRGVSRKRSTLKQKHGVFNPEDPALGPLMKRENAATDSVTEIVVGPNNAHMWFQTVDDRRHRLVLSEPIKSELPLRASVAIL